MRSLRTIALGIVALTLVACSSATPGWTYAPAPAITPPPETSAAPSGAPSAGASAGPSSGASAAPSPRPSGPAPSGSSSGTEIEIAALNIAFDETELAAPADAPFQIVFANNDAGVPHNVEIKDPAGTSLFKGAIFSGVETRTYDVPALAAGTYTFACTVHPNMTGSLTVG
ncbi:MAG: cupredoxin domain-containing protein [Candidatus Limnocylindrales bacterium]